MLVTRGTLPIVLDDREAAELTLVIRQLARTQAVDVPDVVRALVHEAYEQLRKTLDGVPVLHLTEHGLALCRFTYAVPSSWPAGQMWTAAVAEATCPDCQAAHLERAFSHCRRCGVRIGPAGTPEPVCGCATCGGKCCDQAGTYDGFASDGPLRFHCPKGCMCHD